MNLKVGRAVLCAPRTWKDLPWFQDGAHGVTRPTSVQGFKARNHSGNLSLTPRHRSRSYRPESL